MISDTPGKNTEHIFNDLNARFKPLLNQLQKVYKVFFVFFLSSIVSENNKAKFLK